MCRRTVLAVLGAVVLAVGGEARAEVRAVTDRDGNYSMTRVLLRPAGGAHRLVGSDRDAGVWRPLGRGAGARTLNPDGDRHGDLWPLIAEPGQAPHHPWVVWSRLNGAGYDLVFSRWTGGGWSAVAWLWPGIPGDDLDPSVAFDAAGRPYVAWWNESAGRGQVFLTALLGSEWTVPLRISAEGVDARHPLLALDGTSLVVRYRTPEGIAEYALLLLVPASITDDINPLDNETQLGRLRRLRNAAGTEF